MEHAELKQPSSIFEEELVIIEEPVTVTPVEQPRSEQFCTNWKCVTKKVKLITLKGFDVIVSSLNEGTKSNETTTSIQLID